MTFYQIALFAYERQLCARSGLSLSEGVCLYVQPALRAASSINGFAQADNEFSHGLVAPHY
jgi:hypothetical protein